MIHPGRSIQVGRNGGIKYNRGRAEPGQQYSELSPTSGLATARWLVAIERPELLRGLLV